MVKNTEGRDEAGPGHAPVQSVTSAPESMADDQGKRMRRYLIAMGLRLVFFVLAVVTSGWLRWTFVGAAVFLPYIAVVLANAVGPRFGEAVAPVRPVDEERPALTGGIVEAPHLKDGEHPASPEDTDRHGTDHRHSA